MLNPPFKLAPAIASECCAEPHAGPEAGTAPASRMRLAQLDAHLHCSVIGTCIGTAELRKLMARFIDVQGASDLDVHHDAVRLASQNGAVAKTLGKALDQRHDAVIRRFSRTRGPAALAGLWDEALHQGEIPGAYWAVLTHRDADSELRKRAFGDVHMLSHLVGAANRADIRRLVALERDNAELRERLERQQLRSHELLEERDAAAARLQQELIATRGNAAARAVHDAGLAAHARGEDGAAASAQIALHTQRRERAEQAAAMATAEVLQLREELQHLRESATALGRDLAAAETQLRETSSAQPLPGGSLERHLRGRRILYVGGRPSSTPAIRDLVLRHGGEFQRHDGGIEDRKGLLASSVAWAGLVVFPVDCIDHDSAGNLKRICARQGVDFLPLRSAGVATFAAALAALSAEAALGSAPGGTPVCIRHG